MGISSLSTGNELTESPPQQRGTGALWCARVVCLWAKQHKIPFLLHSCAYLVENSFWAQNGCCSYQRDMLAKTLMVKGRQGRGASFKEAKVATVVREWYCQVPAVEGCWGADWLCFSGKWRELCMCCPQVHTAHSGQQCPKYLKTGKI